jgi:hypothetical protein
MINTEIDIINEQPEQSSRFLSSSFTGTEQPKQNKIKIYHKNYYEQNKIRLLEQSKIYYQSIMNNDENKKYLYHRLKQNRIIKNNGELKKKGRPKKYQNIIVVSI